MIFSRDLTVVRKYSFGKRRDWRYTQFVVPVNPCVVVEYSRWSVRKYFTQIVVGRESL